MTFGGIVAYVVLGLLAMIVMAALRKMFFAATGADQPLARKDDNRDIAERGIFEAHASGEMTRTHFSGVTASECPLHGRPYIGYSSFRIDRIAGLENTPKPVGLLHVICCADCVREASACERTFPHWTRANHEKHPVWASTQLYPILVNGQSAWLDCVFTAFDSLEGIELARSMTQESDVLARANGMAALRYRKSPEHIDLARKLLHDTTKLQSFVGWPGEEFAAQSAAIKALRDWKELSESDRALVARTRESPEDKARRESEERRRAEQEAKEQLVKQRLADPTVKRGLCPNCDTVLPLDFQECHRCKASFGAGSAWTIKPS